MPDEHAQDGPPDARYEDLIADLVGEPGVTPPQGGGFGRSAVRFNGKIFVMFVRGQLVLKLPEDRVDEMIAAGHGARFDANKGTPMREWLSLDPGSDQPWLRLAREALDFARSSRSEQRKPGRHGVDALVLRGPDRAARRRA
jgi:hypothetical protein